MVFVLYLISNFIGSREAACLYESQATNTKANSCTARNSYDAHAYLKQTSVHVIAAAEECMNMLCERALTP